MNPQVIHVYFKPFLCDHIGKDVVHECLECWRGITEAEKHDSGLKKAKGSDEHGFPLVFLLDANVIISLLDVELGKQCGVLHVIN